MNRFGIALVLIHAGLASWLAGNADDRIAYRSELADGRVVY